MGLLKDDSRGQIFSIDLLLALIPLTIILGMIGADMDNILYLTQSTVYQSSTERVAADTLNTLIQTTGNPVNWQEDYNNSPITAGLADYDQPKDIPIEGKISTLKLNSLEWTDIQKLLGNESEYEFFLNITSINDNSKIEVFGTNNATTMNYSAHNIVRIERTGLYAKFEIVSSAKDLKRYTGTPRVYSSPPNPFPTNKRYLQLFDYWVVVVNRGYTAATVNINDNKAFEENNLNGPDAYSTIVRKVDPAFLKNNITLTDNIVNVRGRSSPGDSLDVYIVLVPKGTPEDDVNINSATPRKIKFQFYVWTK